MNRNTTQYRRTFLIEYNYVFTKLEKGTWSLKTFVKNFSPFIPHNYHNIYNHINSNSGHELAIFPDRLAVFLRINRKILRGKLCLLRGCGLAHITCKKMLSV